ncbi:MAG: SAM-dependent methyltransferase [Actinobacteria bacterium]|nr:SAM-dependent methyltransferase [Actinomycetota bacterium]
MTPPSSATGGGRVAGSFRDPAGYLFERDGVLLRAVDPSFAETYDAVVASGLYDALHRDGLLVPHEEVDPALAPTPAHRVLRPERLPFISHPFEWSPAQLRDAALLTLRIQDVALDHGMSLRDASAYNVQLWRGRAVFIDTLSFEPRAGEPPWVAYRQFCEHFLAPLALQTEVDVRLRRLLVADVGGVPLDLASTLLPGRTKLKPGLGTHLHAHARAGRTREADAGAERKQARFSDQALRGLVDSLRGTVSKLTWEVDRTTWSDYYADATHYSDAAMRDKETTVARFVERVAPRRVWDLGANTGRFSRIAAKTGAHVVAFDIDEGAVEAAWRKGGLTIGEGEVLPLVLDLANPSPAIGWANEERASVGDRGPVDLVLALALVHHLAIGNNVPLPQVAELLARSARHVVVEFVPKGDPKVDVLLATREDVFPDYTIEGFEAAIAPFFEVRERADVAESTRVLYLLETR